MEQRALDLIKGREQTARLVQLEKEHKINELRARLAAEESAKPKNLEPSKKRTKDTSRDKKKTKKKVKFAEETTTIAPKGIEVDFTPVPEVAAEDLMEEEGPHMYTSTDGWEDETDEEEPPPPQKVLGKMGTLVDPREVTRRRHRYAAGKWYGPVDEVARRTETQYPAQTLKTPQPDPRLHKRPKPDPQSMVQDESTSPGYLNQVVDGVKYHGSKLLSRGAAQLTVLALGGVLMVAKGGLERMAQKHFQPTQTQGYYPPPPPAQSFPSTPTPPQVNNYPVQQTGYQSIDSSPFGPQWK
jgi:hypothetical protein